MILRIPALAGAAAGICSLFYFLGRTIGVSPYITLVVALAACAALVKWVRLPVNDVPSEPPTRWLLIVFFVVLAAAAVTFVWVAVKQPHGYWDAWSIWNMHARFLERGGTHWSAYMTTQLPWTHADYPLLLPSIIAQAWSVLRTESTFIPAAVAFFFTFGTVAVLVGAVRMLRGWDQALIAGTLLLGTATFLQIAVWQYADIPLAFYVVTAVALLCIDDAKSIALAGAMAGFAAWTKNEGLLFIVVLVVARAIALLRQKSGSKLLKELKWFGLGLAPVLAVVALFKFRYAPAGDLLSQRPGEILHRLVDFGRWITVIEDFVKQFFLFGTLPAFIVPGVLVLVVFALLVRFKIDPERRTAVSTAITVVLLMLIADFAVYLLLSQNLAWQVDTSLERVLMQIWPAALLAFFAASSRIALTEPLPEQRKTSKKDAKKAAPAARRK